MVVIDVVVMWSCFILAIDKHTPQDATTNPSLILAASEKAELHRGRRSLLICETSINKTLHINKIYQEIGIPKVRALIRVASAWEGIQAFRIRQSKHGIDCNLALMFSLVQAIAAEAGAFLVFPFVGRVLDWYKAVQYATTPRQTTPV
ncbi:transaldolase [Penicillium canescens]|nr:transaldolase [Penicillium canescens]